MPAKRNLRAEDLFRLRWVGEPEPHPSGRFACVAVRTVDAAGDAYRSHLWRVELASRRPSARGGAARGATRSKAAAASPVRALTEGPFHDDTPRFSPDGRRLAFLSDRAGTGRRDLWILDLEPGSEPHRLGEMPGKALEFLWAPDSSWLAVVRRLPEPRGPVVRKPGAPEEPLCRVVRRVRYKLDGEGFLGAARKEIVRLDARTGRTRVLARAGEDCASPDLSPDGRNMVFVSRRGLPPDDLRDATNLFELNLRSLRLRKLTRDRGPALAPRYSPDGRSVAYLGHEHPEDLRGVHPFHVWLLDRRSLRTRDLMPGWDRSASDQMVSDSIQATGLEPPHFSRDGRELFFAASDRGGCNLYAVSTPGGRSRAAAARGDAPRDVAGRGDVPPDIAEPGGAPRIVAGGEAHLSAPRPLPGGGWIFRRSDFARPAELWTRSPRGAERPLTDFNGPHLRHVRLAHPRPLRARASGGAVPAWVILPPPRARPAAAPRTASTAPARRHPLIVEIHGGPRLQYGRTFVFEMQLLAARGFAVAFSNPRGSQGYGLAWTSAILRDWGGADYEDVMAVAEAAAARPGVDPRRLGVTGGSYGGYLVNWITSRNGRFRAAVTQRSICNLVSKYGTGDFGYSFLSEFGALDFGEPGLYWERSPLRHVASVRTPTLILHSENDLRCPMEQGEQWFNALKLNGVPVEMVRYPGESHGLSRGGTPSRRLDRLRRIADWFERYLMGRKKARRK